MYSHILKLIRQAALNGCVYLTLHANKELKGDNLTYDDALNCLLAGDIVNDQYDPDKNEIKYLIYGDCLNGDEMAVVAKLGYNQDAVIITVYRLRVTDYE